MKIKITGSSGYLGKVIGKGLQKNGHQTEGIQRELLYGQKQKLKDSLRHTDVVINLAGSSIFTRWTEENKKTIYESRIITTRNLVEAINDLPPEERPSKLISASASGIYTSGKEHNENSRDYAGDFIGHVVQDWEKEVHGLNKETTKIIFRMAPVLGRKSEAIKNMMLPFKMGAGGKVGSGKQPFPFVHEEDVARAYRWAAENRSRDAVFNLAAPQVINNKEFTRAFADKLHRPAIFQIPGFMLKLLYGESAEMLLESPALIPAELLKAGFEFKYPAIRDALNEIVNKD